jgi:hypothetical protein
VRRWAAGKALPALLLFCLASVADAGPYTGTSRVSLLPGYRWGLNSNFYASAERVGARQAPGLSGGPGLILSCAYSATDNLEVSIDPFVATEVLHLTGHPSLRSFIYGATLGLRLQFPSETLTPWVGIHTGPILIYAGAPPALANAEAFAQTFGASIGATWRLSERWGVMAQYQFLFGGELSTPLGRIHGKGHWGAVGISYFFPRESGDEGRPPGGF